MLMCRKKQEIYSAAIFLANWLLKVVLYPPRRNYIITSLSPRLPQHSFSPSTIFLFVFLSRGPIVRKTLTVPPIKVQLLHSKLQYRVPTNQPHPTTSNA